MKTFKWTVPELPMTEREKKPTTLEERKKTSGRCLLIIGIIISLYGSLMYFLAEGFGTSLRTYFWEEVTGVVLANDLRFRPPSGYGDVIYQVKIDGREITRTARVFDKWLVKAEEKYKTWSEQYVVGGAVTIYYNSSEEFSLGHWPAEHSLRFGVLGLSNLFLGLSLVYRGIMQIKAEQNAAEQNATRIQSKLK